MAEPENAGKTLALRFVVRKDVGIEDFGDRSLVLLCDSLRLREINALSRQLLSRMDGERTIREMAAEAAAEHGVPPAEMEMHAAEAILQMERQGIVRRVVKLRTERPVKMSQALYLANPDVSFRQEGDDGGILFNADTDSLQILNPIAVEIWMFLAAPHTRTEVVRHLCEVCADAPPDQVDKDVGEFIDSLLGKGFIGVVESAS